MSSNIFTGTIPALMTPCTAERKPDFDALVRKGRELIQAGMSAVVYCGSMGDWPLLSLVTFLPILGAYYLTRDGDQVAGGGK